MPAKKKAGTGTAMAAANKAASAAKSAASAAKSAASAARAARAPMTRYQKGARRVKRAIRGGEDVLFDMLVAGAAGYGIQSGLAANLPHIAAVGRLGTYGLAALAVGTYAKAPLLKRISRPLLTIAAFQFSRGGFKFGAEGSGIEGEIIENV